MINITKENLITLSGITYIVYKLYNQLKKKELTYIEKIQQSKNFILEQVNFKTIFIPKVGIILGSGQNELIEKFEILTEISYNKIPFFPTSTVEGHIGKLILARMNNIDIVIMQGRFHSYEGYSTKEVSFPVRVMKSLGIKTLIITNSSGATNKNLNVGDIIVVKDHIYLPALVGFNPLSGPNDSKLGERFIALNNIYNKKHRKYILGLAKQLPELKESVKEGIYCGVAGPCYETPAEVKLMNLIGCDIVGMSTIPEVIIAAHSNIDVLVLGLVTNKCIDTDDSQIKPNHKEVCENAKKAINNLQYLINNFIKHLSNNIF